MRCATCGTENAPDSRFCGGCGARMLAPTAKISDDAAYPAPSSMQSTGVRPASVPPGPISYAPPSMPPRAGAAPKSQPSPFDPTGAQSAMPAPSKPPSPQPGSDVVTAQRPVSAPPRPRAPHVSSASGSFAAPPQRPVGLIALVLIVDLGLAAAGAMLLAKGLGGKDKKSDATDKKVDSASSPAPTPAPAPAPAPSPAGPSPDKKSQAPAPAKAMKGAMTQPPSAKAAPASQGPRNDALPSAAARKDTTPKASRDAHRVDKVPALAPSAPQDPDNADVERELAHAFARSRAAFTRCATEAGAVHGAIEVAYQVRSDGRVINAAAVENSTGNTELARCLVAEIASWQVSAHGGEPLTFARPFTYP